MGAACGVSNLMLPGAAWLCQGLDGGGVGSQAVSHRHFLSFKGTDNRQGPDLKSCGCSGLIGVMDNCFHCRTRKEQ